MNEETLLRELNEIERALSGILVGGQSNSLNSGGGSRSVTMPDYAALVKRKKEILYELSCIQGSTAQNIAPGW
ncbi:MAG: hypothetical protein LBO67_03390 [Spirochaetaceae bacterium]|jgi:hypothetical protein|nr:hypothetical protein [Spirochaetaceae bacterium]